MLQVKEKNVSKPRVAVVVSLVAVNVSVVWIGGVGKTWEVFAVPYKIKDQP